MHIEIDTPKNICMFLVYIFHVCRRFRPIRQLNSIQFDDSTQLGASIQFVDCRNESARNA